MTTYNSYEAAKIANPSDDIATTSEFWDGADYVAGKFRVLTSVMILDNFSWEICKPSDHCMTVEKFLADGHRFVEGDIITEGISVKEITSNITHVMNKAASCDAATYILRAAALENQMNIDKVETQAPEEAKPEPKQGDVWRCILLPRQYVIYLYKAHNEWDTDWVNQELLEGQSIKPIQKLYTQSEGAGEWSNGDECLYMNSSEVHKFIGIDPTRSDFCYIKANCSAVNWVEAAKLSKPEPPQQREERERLEAAYDLFVTYCKASKSEPCTFDVFSRRTLTNTKEQWLAVVDKTNYRKGVK